METRDIPLDQIKVSAFNTRKDMSAGTEDADIDGLANSIRDWGLLSPITVRVTADGLYDLVAGQRRYLAYQRLGRSTIPAIINGDLDDTGATVVSLVENVHRADMNPMDKARAYQGIYVRYGDVERVAKETGVTAQTVRRYLPLLKLTQAIQDEVSTSDGVASVVTLSKLGDTVAPEDQEKFLDQIRGLNARSQLRIIQQSGGRISEVPDIKMQVLEDTMNMVTCREGLCFSMPEAMKDRIKAELERRS